MHVAFLPSSISAIPDVEKGPKSRRKRPGFGEKEMNREKKEKKKKKKGVAYIPSHSGTSGLFFLANYRHEYITDSSLVHQSRLVHRRRKVKERRDGMGG